MKNNFQSKAVPRGTRTIWRYLSALILLFSLSIGQMWGAEVAFTAGASTAIAKKVSASSPLLYMVRGGGGATYTSDYGIQLKTDLIFVFTIDGTTNLSVNLKSKDTNNAGKDNKFKLYSLNTKQVGFLKILDYSSSNNAKLDASYNALKASDTDVTDFSSTSLSNSKYCSIADNPAVGSQVGDEITIHTAKNSPASGEFSSLSAGTYILFCSAAPTTNVCMYSMTFTAATSYTVTIDPNGGAYAEDPDGWTKSAGVYTKSIASGTSFTAPAGLTNSGKDLSWKDGDGNGITFPVSITGDITFVAQWAPHAASSDATLSALSVAGCTFNETFDPATFAYTVDLPFYGTMPAVGDVTATPNDANAKTPAVSISSNKITIACEAEDGTKKNYTITVTIAPAPAASSSINIEQLVLDNSTKYNIGDALDAAHIAYVDKDALDSLKDQSGRNEPYLGLKFKKSSSKITVVVPAEKVLNIKWGNISTAIKVKINGESQSDDITTTSTGSIYHLNAANIVRQVEFSVAADKKTIVLKQVMVGEDIKTVTLPWLVTYDAGEHGTCATAKEVWTGTALTLPEVTPESGWDFDGWFDGGTQVTSPYNPGKNAALEAHYTAQASPFDLTALTYKIGEGAATNVGYVDGTFTYNIELPYKPSYDAITVAPTLKVGTSSIKEGAVLTVSSLPGAATFTVVENGGANEKLYTVNFSKAAKDGACLIKVTADTYNTNTVTPTGAGTGWVSLSNGDSEKSTYDTYTGYKMNTNGRGIRATLAEGNFQENDVVEVFVTHIRDGKKLQIFSYDGSDYTLQQTAEEGCVLGVNRLTMGALSSVNSLAVYRDGSNGVNPDVAYLAVYRAMNPVLTAITINERAGVIDPLDDKHFNVQIPYEADLANLTIVPTIAWNAPAAENSIVVNDGGAWVEGNNTYKLTDKDGDFSVYTISLTRDVQKFVVTYFDGETNLGTEEVEKNGHPTATGIVAPTKKGKIFLGWNQSSTATAAEDLNDITITAVKNLYAIYEDIDCSGTGVKFSMTPKANELTENYEPKGDEERDYAEYATLVGGKVFINNVAASEKRISVLKETSHIKFEGGDDGYIHVELDCPLNEKDTIKIENDQKWQVSVAKGSGYVAKLKTDKYHVVPAAWDGKYDFYIKRNSSNLTVNGIQVVRPAKYTVSFDMMGHGSAIAPITNVFDGTKISAPTAPTDENYSFAGWYKENTLANEWKFDVDVVEANTTLYAKWLDKSDATLKSLKYGETEIALEDGVYTYNVNVSALVSGVPALTAVTNNPAATAVVTDDDAFDGEGKATSTVEVTPEKEGAAHQTYTVKFTKLPLYTDIVDVTGYTEWSWAGVATAEVKINDVANRGVILANYIDAPHFEMLAGQENARAYRSNSYPAYQGTYLKFHATVPGRLTIKARNSSGSPILRVNGIDLATLNGTPKDYITAVPEGDVEITSSADEFRIYAMTFDPAVDYTRDVTEGKYGTICLPTNGVMIGTTIYTLAFYGATSQKIFFDEVVTGRMEAGKPYLFLPEQGVTELKVFYTDSETKAAQAVNGFHGYIGDSEDPEDALQVEAGVGNYIVQNNQYREIQAGATAYILSHRAYIKFSEIGTTEPAKAPGARRIGLGKDAAQGFENLQSGDQPMKVMIDGTLYIIRGEKVYNANGQVVK